MLYTIGKPYLMIIASNDPEVHIKMQNSVLDHSPPRAVVLYMTQCEFSSRMGGVISKTAASAKLRIVHSN